MKTIKQVISERPEYSRLIKAVLRNINKEDIESINRHGADGGYGNFIYYADTHRFAVNNRKQIVELLEEDAEHLCNGDIMAMINGFGVFRGSMDKDDKKDLYRYLSGAKVEQGAVTNVMAWFAAEEVCRWFEE